MTNLPYAHDLCTRIGCIQALRNNPSLLVIIVAPVKTDLPRGIVGEWIDWSQDQSMQPLARSLSLSACGAPLRLTLYY